MDERWLSTNSKRQGALQSVHRRNGKEWAFVERTNTGVPLSELAVVTPKSGAASRPLPRRHLQTRSRCRPMTKEREYLRGVLFLATRVTACLVFR